MDDLRSNYQGGDLTLSGIGGWLAFFGICLVLSAILSLVNVIKSFTQVFEGNALFIIYDSNKAIFSVIVFELVFSLLIFISLVFLSILFIRKSKRFPNLMFYYMILNCVIIFIDSILVTQYVKPLLDIQPPSIIQPIIYLLVWGTYIKTSKRVANTFID